MTQVDMKVKKGLGQKQLKIKIWISWGSLAFLQELKTRADFQTNRLKPLCDHLAVLAVGSGQWHQKHSGSKTPQKQKVCETLLMPCMVSVPLIFQTHTNELDCKTGRNQSTNAAFFIYICKISCHEATDKFILQVMSGKEVWVRHCKTLLKYIKPYIK